MNINFKDRSVIFLITVNLFPLIGVLLFDWDALMVVIFYCIETFIIGLFNVLKMIRSDVDAPTAQEVNLSKNQETLSNLHSEPGCLKFFLVPFFIVHYNIFVIAQGFAIIVISVEFFNSEMGVDNFLSYDFIINVILIVLSHAYSYYKNYILKKEYKKISVSVLMFLPYKRVIIQQVTVIFGTFLILMFEASLGYLILLIGLKLFFDIRSHYKTHDLSDKRMSIF